LPILSISQDKEQDKKIGLKFSGFVKADIFWDSRQVVAIRNGHFLLYPTNEKLDENGVDINAHPSFNILTIQTRLRLDVKGPDALGAKTSGAIEGEFFGHANGDINGFRLRHAYVKLDWTRSMLLVGQYWHPMFITSCYPGTVSFNTGVPFLPFSRNPQIRYRYQAGAFNAYGTIATQLDFKSNGPYGASSEYLMNSVLPMLNLRLEYSKKNADAGTELVFGASANYKMLTPRLVSSTNYQTKETISTMSATAYFKYKFPALTIKLQGSYGADVFDLTMIGGYAVKDSTDKEMDFVTYTPLNTAAVWADIHTNGKKMQAGLFMAYAKNLGANETIEGAYYARGSDIGYAWRISPRFIYNVGKFRIAPEIEYTVAAYGTPDLDGSVMDTKAIGNFRFLLGVYFFFDKSNY
jgi:hypothetical protein